jgi:hypothetical protein
LDGWDPALVQTAVFLSPPMFTICPLAVPGRRLSYRPMPGSRGWWLIMSRWWPTWRRTVRVSSICGNSRRCGPSWAALPGWLCSWSTVLSTWTRMGGRVWVLMLMLMPSSPFRSSAWLSRHSGPLLMPYQCCGGTHRARSMSLLPGFPVVMLPNWSAAWLARTGCPMPCDAPISSPVPACRRRRDADVRCPGKGDREMVARGADDIFGIHNVECAPGFGSARLLGRCA